MNQVIAVLSLALCALSSASAPYSPLSTGMTKPVQHELTVKDEKRAREIPLRVYLPEGKSAAPVVLFSHGLGGSRAGSPFLGGHWAARGYAAVFLQHPGSDESVWRGKPLGERMAAMRAAANVENFLLRARDVPAVLDQLQAWHADGTHALRGRLDMARVGMAGHSFGAVTTQAVSGQAFRAGSFAEPRIRAAVLMSPSVPRRGGDPKEAFGGVKIPWMLLTGTRDSSPIEATDPASRLQVFAALSPGSKYELVLDGAEHSAFTDRRLPGEQAERNPNHHRAILALTTAFWDAHLREDAAARKWLDGEEARSVLEKGDRWQRK